MALPLFSLTGTQIFGITVSYFNSCRIPYGAWTEAVRSLAGVFLSVVPRNEMVFPRESRERTVAIWCHGGNKELTG